MTIRTACGTFLFILPACSHSGGGGATPPLTVLEAPSELKGLQSGRSARLEWTDNSTTEEGFRIEQQYLNSTDEWFHHSTVDANATSWTSPASELNNCYTWRVRAFAGEQLSEPSNTTTVCTSPPSGPTNCALVLGEQLATTEDWATNASALWFAVPLPEGEQVVASVPPTPHGEAMMLDGGVNGPALLEVRRQDTIGGTRLELAIVFGGAPGVTTPTSGELCLLLHDLALGSYEDHGLRMAQRRPHVLQVPVVGTLPVVPRRKYRVTIFFDRAFTSYDLLVDDLMIASGLPIDCVVVVPATYYPDE